MKYIPGVTEYSQTFGVVRGGGSKGNDLRLGTCGRKGLVHTDIGVGVAAGKLDSPSIWCQHDDALVQLTHAVRNH